jgi:hypothetical protein
VTTLPGLNEYVVVRQSVADLVDALPKQVGLDDISVFNDAALRVWDNCLALAENLKVSGARLVAKTTGSQHALAEDLQTYIVDTASRILRIRQAGAQALRLAESGQLQEAEEAASGAAAEVPALIGGGMKANLEALLAKFDTNKLYARGWIFSV